MFRAFGAMGYLHSPEAKVQARRPAQFWLLLLATLALTVSQVGPMVSTRAQRQPLPQTKQHIEPPEHEGSQAHRLPLPAALQPLAAEPAAAAAAVAAALPRHSNTSALSAEEAAVGLPGGSNDSYVSICIIVKNEHCDIREWVLHHASVGVGKFYMFDTQSEPPMRPVLEDLIASGLVAYHYLTNDTTEVKLEVPPPGRSINWQRPIYDLCIRRYGPFHKWMGFIDADEFVVMEGATPQDPGSLPTLLGQHEQHGGLVLHWLFFASAGHVLRPAGGVMASYTACNTGVNSQVKSFVQPEHVKRLQTVHNFVYKRKKFAVNTAGVQVAGPKVRRELASTKGAVLHHYISRSLADFEVKTQRRGGAGSVKTLADFILYHKNANDTCTSAVPLGQALAAQYDLSRNVPARCLDTERRRRLLRHAHR